MPTLPKVDLCKLHRADYAAPRKPVLLTIPPACYLTARGQGPPGGEVFQARIGALYGAAFTVKMTRKFAGLQDYAIGKLEAQYFFDTEQVACQTPPDQWRWRLLIRTPDFVAKKDLDQALAALKAKGKVSDPKAVALETIEEGLCVQMLHVGPYDREPDTVAVMRQFAEQQKLKLCGPHHEIYLSDPRRVPPERLKTILREPVARK
jgi:hypothetical protein